jgi:hypothetical protein
MSAGRTLLITCVRGQSAGRSATSKKAEAKTHLLDRVHQLALDPLFEALYARDVLLFLV